MRRRLALLPVGLLLVAGCSLPLPRGVEAVGDVPAEQREPAPLAVIPPGPKAGATPQETVLGFLGAQSSSSGEHAIARQFLTERERALWQDDQEVQVYDPDHLELVTARDDTTGATVVRVTAQVNAQIRSDGSYLTRPGVTVTEQYRLARVAGQWRLDDVPDGLRLTSADRLRSYTARNVYYLASAGHDAGPRLVADRVFLPVGPDLAESLVRRLVRPPSQGVAGSVVTAVPTGTRFGSVTKGSGGVFTVDLVGVAARPVGQAAQDLSAQLVWTLRSLGSAFRGLRLRVDGSPLPVPTAGQVQRAGDWDVYDPDGVGPDAYYFVTGRRLRASADLPAGAAANVPADVVAVTPDGQRAALLDTAVPARTVVRVGRLDGRSFPVVARGQLVSPSWGSGSLGLWMLRAGTDVVRVVGSTVRPVTVLGQPSGRFTALALGRDGVRVALVAGGRLYTGRVEVVHGEPRIVDLVQALPDLRDVRAVAWSSSTSLVVLGVLTRQVQVLQLPLDGSSVVALSTSGLTPTGLAAGPAGVVLAAGGRLYLSTGEAFRQVQPDGAEPVFPG